MGLEKIGAVWVGETRDGKRMYSISYNDEKYYIFENDKQTEKHPDYTINISTDEPKNKDIPF